MFKSFGAAALTDSFDAPIASEAGLLPSGHLDALIALEQIGSRRSFARDEEIYGEGAACDCWFRVVSGTVRISKLLADGRRHIAEFCYGGDCFGLDGAGERMFSAEAIGDVVVMRFPRRATERLIDENPQLARGICDIALRDLAHAQNRLFLLGRMTAAERVANFLLELSERRNGRGALEVPMSRNDIADYLGLTIETVCRILSGLRRAGAIAIPSPHRIELRNREALAVMCEA